MANNKGSDEKNVVHVKKSDFVRMYRTMKIKKMATELNVSTGTIYRMLDELGIERVGKKRLILD